MAPPKSERMLRMTGPDSGEKVSGGFIQNQNIGALQNHLQEKSTLAFCPGETGERCSISWVVNRRLPK